jgi:hypothetical protein
MAFKRVSDTKIEDYTDSHDHLPTIKYAQRRHVFLACRLHKSDSKHRHLENSYSCAAVKMR